MSDKKHDALQFRLEKALVKPAQGLGSCDVERIPEDLDLCGWESPSTEDHTQACLEMVDLCNRAWAAAGHHSLVVEPEVTP